MPRSRPVISMHESLFLAVLFSLLAITGLQSTDNRAAKVCRVDSYLMEADC
jgi:hypothetical protein